MKNKTYKSNGLVFESIVNLKKYQRGVDQAREECKHNPINGFDPGHSIYEAHVKAKEAAIESVKREIKD